MKRLLMAGMIGMVMMAGSGLWGKDGKVAVKIDSPAAVTLPNGTKTVLVKTGGAVSGTHATQPSGTTVSGKMTGSKGGTVSPANDGTFTATAGEASNKVNDSKIIIEYKKNEKPIAKGSANFTVVGLELKFWAKYTDRAGQRMKLRIKGRGLPKGLGGTTGAITFIGTQYFGLNNANPPPLPFRFTSPTNRFNWTSPEIESAANNFVGVKVGANVTYVFTFDISGNIGAKEKNISLIEK